MDAQLDSLREQFKSRLPTDSSRIQSSGPGCHTICKLDVHKEASSSALPENRIQRAAKISTRQRAAIPIGQGIAPLVDNDLEQYDDILTEEWAIRFDQVQGFPCL